MFTLNCKGRLLPLDVPAVMGIINITPDSFFTGNRKPEVQAAVDMAGRMLAEGASILDLGGQSTRPGSTLLTAQEELERLLPALEGIVKAFPEAIISIDTFYSQVAQATVAAGAGIVNDISGGTLDGEMITTVGQMQNVPYICMHMRGTPQTMTHMTQYENMLTGILDFFIGRQEACRVAGIKDFIVDPGMGFAKNTAQNFELLRRLQAFQILNNPILVGLSRKGMIYKTLGITPEKALNGTTVLNMAALQNGANILRVHDVKEAAETVRLYQLLSLC